MIEKSSKLIRLTSAVAWSPGLLCLYGCRSARLCVVLWYCWSRRTVFEMTLHINLCMQKSARSLCWTQNLFLLLLTIALFVLRLSSGSNSSVLYISAHCGSVRRLMNTVITSEETNSTKIIAWKLINCISTDFTFQWWMVCNHRCDNQKHPN